MTERIPYFPMYPKDWLDFRVQRMSYEAQGIYHAILCYMWKDSKDQSSIRSDEKALAKALGLTITKLRKNLLEIQEKNDPIFIERDGFYHSKRLAKERRQYLTYRKTRIAAGKLGAKNRWLSHRSAMPEPMANGMANTMAKDSTSTSPSTSSSKDKKTVAPLTPLAAAAFELYQREIGITSPIAYDELKYAIGDYGDEWVCDAIKEAATHNVRNLAYIKAILSRWKNEGKYSKREKEEAHVVLADGTTIATKEEFESLAAKGEIDWNERKRVWEKIPG